MVNCFRLERREGLGVTRGRPRKPTAVHILNGNPSKIPDLEVRFAQEPQFDSYSHDNVPKPHKDCKGRYARACWKEVAPVLASQRLLTTADLHMLMSYCNHHQDYVSARLVLSREGYTMVGARGEIKPRPEVAIMQKADRAKHEIAREFGMTPAARGRMVSPAAKEEEDEMARLIREAR